MRNLENNPADRNLETVEDGFDDDLDVPTYRKLADSETEAAPKKRYDAYAASGRTAPQVIKPNSAAKDAEDSPAAADSETAESETELMEAAPTAAAKSTTDSDGDTDTAARTEVISAPEPEPERLSDTTSTEAADAGVHDDSAPTTVMPPQTAYEDSDETVAVGAGAAGATVLATEESNFDEDSDFHDEEEPETRRGTLDLGLLLLRIALGGLLLVHGLTTFFGWGAAPNTTALATEFANQGFKLSTVLGSAIPTIQVIAGALIVLGLATPLGSALALALSAYLVMFDVASADATGWKILGNGAEAAQLHLLLFAVALALQFTGPGRIGVDFGRGWARRPLASSWLFCIIAVAVAAVAWYFTAGSWPFVG